MPGPRWGIDVSTHQNRFDHARAAGEGYRLCIAKATQGATLNDDQFPRNARVMPQEYDYWGSYHFLVRVDGKEQAENYLRSLDANDAFEGMVSVDFEEYYSAPRWTPTNRNLSDFFDRIRKEIPESKPILLYANPSFWNSGDPSGPISDYDPNVITWVPRYPNDYLKDIGSRIFAQVKEYEPSGFGGQDTDLWQFTQRALVAGQHIDANYIYAPESRLQEAMGESEKDVNGKSYSINIFDPTKSALDPAHFSSRKTARKVVNSGIDLPDGKELRVVRRNGERNVIVAQKNTKKEARFSHLPTVKRVDAELDEVLRNNKSKASVVLKYGKEPKKPKKKAPITDERRWKNHLWKAFPSRGLQLPKSGGLYYERYPTRLHAHGGWAGWDKDVADLMAYLEQNYDLSAVTYKRHWPRVAGRMNGERRSADLWDPWGRTAPIDVGVYSEVHDWLFENSPLAIEYCIVGSGNKSWDWMFNRGNVLTSRPVGWSKYYPPTPAFGHWNHGHYTFIPKEL